MKKNEMRSGSALIVVLGMTAVLMMMAIAFSVLMRTERSGMTNLKHSLTARQTTHTAIARAMAAIDESFKNPTNNWPIAGWDPPYISSWKNKTSERSYWQNVSITSTTERKDNARLLTDELSRHLSPSQLALAKNAKIDWVTIRSGVGASEIPTGLDPLKDMIIARYAFLAFNTTGLLDMNIGPLTNAPSAGNQDLITVNQNAIKDTLFVKFLGVAGNSDYMKERSRLGGFSSYAEMWRALMGPDRRYTFEDPGKDLELDDIVTPDLFNTFSMSLDEVDPDGKMKLPIPQDTSKSAFGDGKKHTYAKLALERFEKIFASERPEVKLASKPLPELTRAKLATQALIDYIDEDSKPDGGIWESGEDPLNYPCTEAVPMIHQVYSAVEIMDSAEITTLSPQHPTVDPVDPTTWYTQYTVKLAVSCHAMYHGSDPQPSGYSVDGTFKFKLGSFADFAENVWLGSGPREGRRELRFNNQSVAEFFSGKTPEDYVAINLPEAPPDPLSVVKSFAFSVRTKPKTYQYDEFGNEIGVTAYYAFSDQEEDDKDFAGLEVLIEAEVVSAADGVVQKVPAPALADDEYKIRVLPGIRPSRVSGAPQYRKGWALCLDPRFAYNTSCIKSYPPGENYSPWLTDIMCFNPTREGVSDSGSISHILNIESAYGNGLLTEIADQLVDLDGRDNLSSEPGQLNPLLTRVVFKNFGDRDETPDRSAVADQFDGFSNRQKIYPDVFHSERNTGQMFVNRGGDSLKQILQFIVANKPMTSIGEFGNLVIGPWETLSLFATFAPGGGNPKIDFHRVSDYFSLKEARFPKVSDIPETGIDRITDEYLPAIYAGKLNLNPQLKVRWDSIMGFGKPIDEFNVDPLAVLFASAEIDEAGSTRMSFGVAQDEAAEFYADPVFSGQHRNDPFPMFRYTSDIGNVNVVSNLNPVLSAVMATGAAKTDADRERFLGSVLDRLTTRGQTYLVIVRADAYSPKYGSESPLDGTTLATEYALVELWRDSEPNRSPDGDYYPEPEPDSDPRNNKPFPVHGWFIRSCRFFSP